MPSRSDTTPGSRERASDARRRAILDAALELFLDSGVGDCRVEDLLERSGASVGSLYHHFGSKQGVAAELYLEILEEFHRDFLAALKRHRTARAGVRGVVIHHLEWVAEDPQRAAYFFQCLEPDVSTLCMDRDQQMRGDFFRECLTWLDAAASDGEIRKLSPLEFYALWLGPSLELTRAWLMNNQGKWNWMSRGQRRPEALMSAQKNLADAAWQALRAG